MESAVPCQASSVLLLGAGAGQHAGSTLMSTEAVSTVPAGFIGRRLCPELVFAKPDFQKYSKAAQVRGPSRPGLCSCCKAPYCCRHQHHIPIPIRHSRSNLLKLIAAVHVAYRRPEQSSDAMTPSSRLAAWTRPTWT